MKLYLKGENFHLVMQFAIHFITVYMEWTGSHSAYHKSVGWPFRIVEPCYNEVLGTIKITLLYQVSHYILCIQWNIAETYFKIISLILSTSKEIYDADDEESVSW